MFKFSKCQNCHKQTVEDDTTFCKANVDSEQLVLFDVHTGKPWYELIKFG